MRRIIALSLALLALAAACNSGGDEPPADDAPFFREPAGDQAVTDEATAEPPPASEPAANPPIAERVDDDLRSPDPVNLESPPDVEVVNLEPSTPEHPLLLYDVLTGDTVTADVRQSRVSWSADGMRLAAQIGPQLFAIVNVPAGTTERLLRFNRTIRPQEFALSPEGTRLAVAWESDVVIVSLQAEVLQRFEARDPLGLHWSPDGSALAYTNRSPGNQIDVWDGLELHSFAGFELAGWVDDGRLVMVAPAGADEEAVHLSEAQGGDSRMGVDWVVSLRDPELDFGEQIRWRVQSTEPLLVATDGRWVVARGVSEGPPRRDASDLFRSLDRESIIYDLETGDESVRLSGRVSGRISGAVGNFNAVMGIFFVADACRDDERLLRWDGHAITEVLRGLAPSVRLGPVGLPLIVVPFFGAVVAVDQIGDPAREIIDWPWEGVSRSPDGRWLAYGTQVAGSDYCV